MVGRGGPDVSRFDTSLVPLQVIKIQTLSGGLDCGAGFSAWQFGFMVTRMQRPLDRISLEAEKNTSERDDTD